MVKKDEASNWVDDMDRNNRRILHEHGGTIGKPTSKRHSSRKWRKECIRSLRPGLIRRGRAGRIVYIFIDYRQNRLKAHVLRQYGTFDGYQYSDYCGFDKVRV